MVHDTTWALRHKYKNGRQHEPKVKIAFELSSNWCVWRAQESKPKKENQMFTNLRHLNTQLVLAWAQCWPGTGKERGGGGKKEEIICSLMLNAINVIFVRYSDEKKKVRSKNRTAVNLLTMYHPLSVSLTSRIFNCQARFSACVTTIRWFLVITCVWIVNIVCVSTRSHAICKPKKNTILCEIIKNPFGNSILCDSKGSNKTE